MHIGVTNGPLRRTSSARPLGLALRDELSRKPKNGPKFLDSKAFVIVQTI